MGRIDDIQARINRRFAQMDARIKERMAHIDKALGGQSPDAAMRTPVRVSRSAALDDSALHETAASFLVRVHGVAPNTMPKPLCLTNDKKLNALIQEQILPLAPQWAAAAGVPIGAFTVSIKDKFEQSLAECNIPLDDSCLATFSEGNPPPGDASSAAAVNRAIRAAIAYYDHCLGFSGIRSVDALFAWLEAKIATDLCTFKGFGHYYNACSYGFTGGSGTLLLLSQDCHSEMCVAHELTHSVSDACIGWGDSYFGECGAINESFSDIFAVFSKWAWYGRENIEDPWDFDGCRHLAYPEKSEECKKTKWVKATWYLQVVGPDGSNTQSNQGWYWSNNPNNAKDRNGVHINNGVICFLCHLLCEGRDFTRSDGRVFSVRPIGHEKAQRLFAALLLGHPIKYLPKNVTMFEMYYNLMLAAQDMGFTEDDLAKIETACDAVNIIPPSGRGGASPVGRSLGLSGVRAAGIGELAAAITRTCHAELGLDADGAEARLVSDANLSAPGVRGNGRQLDFDQTLRGIPVFGATAMVRVAGGAITHFRNGFSRSLSKVSLKDKIGADGARKAVIEADKAPVLGEPEKVIFDPALLHLAGAPALAWRVETGSGSMPSNQHLVDAATGKIVFTSPLHTS